jgi:hypothetical protein
MYIFIFPIATCSHPKKYKRSKKSVNILKFSAQ